MTRHSKEAHGLSKQSVQRRRKHTGRLIRDGDEADKRWMGHGYLLKAVFKVTDSLAVFVSLHFILAQRYIP
jgi:hypothetical protein